MSARFEEAVDAVVSGDAATLRALLREEPSLVHARSSREHHATLLNYIAANGVENERQRTPANAIEIATMLLDGGADVNAKADVYEGQWDTLGLLVSSVHPHAAGLQGVLAELLLDRGAEMGNALLTSLAFGYRDTAEVLARRGAPMDLAGAAGLGRVDEVRRLLPAADAETRHIAFALAAQHGHVEIVRLLLDAGEDPDRYNPRGYHAHSTPMHQAAWAGHEDVVRLLVERGARTDLRDTIHGGTPQDWAGYRRTV